MVAVIDNHCSIKQCPKILYRGCLALCSLRGARNDTNNLFKLVQSLKKVRRGIRQMLGIRQKY